MRIGTRLGLQRVLDAFDDTPMFPNAAHLIASSEFNFWPRTLARLPENRQSFAAGAKRRLKRVLERLESVAPGQRHWMPAADHHDALGAAAMRRGLLDKLATDRQRVIGFHLPFPGVAGSNAVARLIISCPNGRRATI